jgi:predicted nucleic-acid-binding Zn-ribbon protein
VENELMIIRPLNTKLHRACQQVLDCLDVGGEQSRQFAEEIKILRDALNSTPMVKDDCPKCGAGSDERELTGKDFLDIEAIHMHYTCKKCGSEIIEEFTLSDVFIDDSHT